MSVSYEGFNVNALTFNCSAEIAKGKPVKINKSSHVAQCTDGDSFHGIVVDSDSKYASVQVAGVVTISYSGTAPATGYTGLCADGNGGVKTSTSGEKHLVFATDTAAKTVTFLM